MSAWWPNGHEVRASHLQRQIGVPCPEGPPDFEVHVHGGQVGPVVARRHTSIGLRGLGVVLGRYDKNTVQTPLSHCPLIAWMHQAGWRGMLELALLEAGLSQGWVAAAPSGCSGTAPALWIGDCAGTDTTSSIGCWVAKVLRTAGGRPNWSWSVAWARGVGDGVASPTATKVGGADGRRVGGARCRTLHKPLEAL